MVWPKRCEASALRSISRVTRFAVLPNALSRSFSEAARALPSEMRTQYPETPWRAIIGIGNVLRHDYQHLDDRRLWEIVTVHLPALRPVVLSMLTEIDGKSKP
jgi:uncharacterized protein with HEPN domain